MDNSNGQLQTQCSDDRNCQCKEEKVAIAHETRSHDIHKTNPHDDKGLNGQLFSSSGPSTSNKDTCRDEIIARKPTKRTRKLNSTGHEQGNL